MTVGTETGASVASMGAGSLSSAGSDILMLREQIDAMDAAIVALVAERSRLSHRIQNARLHAGGTRVELGRERVILAHYRDALGPDGPTLADAVLQVCRGRR